LIETYPGPEAISGDESGYLKPSEAREIRQVGTFLYFHSELVLTLLNL